MEDAEEAILRVWHDNAAPWTRAVREGRIASRRQVTDAAITRSIRTLAPRSAIDLGCGEGWLVRAMAGAGIDALGVDAVPELVEQARRSGGGRFVAMDYAQVAAGGLDARAEVVVCNFSLLGGESVDRLLRAVPALLHDGGTLLIQTLHPWTACGDAPYRDGWRDGSWAGCGEGFGDAAPWYFRSMAGWMAGFRDAGLALVGLEEPLHPDTGRPASAIFALRPVSPLP